MAKINKYSSGQVYSTPAVRSKDRQVGLLCTQPALAPGSLNVGVANVSIIGPRGPCDYKLGREDITGPT